MNILGLLKSKAVLIALAGIVSAGGAYAFGLIKGQYESQIDVLTNERDYMRTRFEREQRARKDSERVIVELTRSSEAFADRTAGIIASLETAIDNRPECDLNPRAIALDNEAWSRPETGGD